MRKKTIKFTADTIFWYIIYLLPILLVFATILSKHQYISDVQDYYFLLNNWLCAFDIDETLSISSAFTEAFGFLFDAGAGNYLIFAYMQYFIACYITHLAVDFILFIPRLAHKWMDNFTRCE